MDSKGLRLIKEAYGGIYINQEEEIISESDCGCEHEKGKKDKKKEEIVAEEQLDEAGGPALPGEPGRPGTPKAPGGRPHLPGEKETPAPKKRMSLQLAGVDLFDIVKGHLMSEGYADTEEAALAIMANMSEEWRQSIVEQMVVNVADVKGGTQAAKNAQAGMTNKVTGKPLYKPGVGVGPDFKLLKGV